jgi:hypothetical protein
MNLNPVVGETFGPRSRVHPFNLFALVAPEIEASLHPWAWSSQTETWTGGAGGLAIDG